MVFCLLKQNPFVFLIVPDFVAMKMNVKDLEFIARSFKHTHARTMDVLQEAAYQFYRMHEARLRARTVWMMMKIGL